MLISLHDAFSSRNNEVQVNHSHLQRIIDSYNLAKRDQARALPCYQVGNEWRPIYERFMHEWIAALTARNETRVNQLLRNFFREDFSAGLHGLHFDMVKKYMTPGQPLLQQDVDVYMDLVVINLNLFLRNCPHTPIEALTRPVIGNPYGFRVDDTFVNFGADIHFYTAQKIGILLKSCVSTRVLELGGGYGGMAYFLLRDNPDCTYIDMDLPENAALTAYYLLTAFPEKKFALYGEIDMAKDDLDQFDGIIMPNFEMEKLKPNTIDLSFNAYSLAEMSPETITNYIRIICEVTRKNFYHINHAVHSVVSADLFGVNPEKFDLLFRMPCMWGKSKDRNPDIDEHEYVYVTKS